MISEQLLEDFLTENLDLIESGLSLIKRQFPIGRRIDLLCKDKFGKLTAIEIKIVADQPSIKQVLSYKENIQLILPEAKMRLFLVCLDTKKDVEKLCKKNNIKYVQIKDKRIPNYGDFTHLPRIQRSIIYYIFTKKQPLVADSNLLALYFRLPEKEIIQHMNDIFLYCHGELLN